MNKEKPTWTLVAHVGIIGHDRVLVSLATPHFINGIIKEKQKLSINMVTEEMLPEVDLSGALSGTKNDKSGLFEYEVGENGTPIISKAPLTMECPAVSDTGRTFEDDTTGICRCGGTFSGRKKTSFETDVHESL